MIYIFSLNKFTLNHMKENNARLENNKKIPDSILTIIMEIALK